MHFDTTLIPDLRSVYNKLANAKIFTKGQSNLKIILKQLLSNKRPSLEIAQALGGCYSSRHFYTSDARYNFKDLLKGSDTWEQHLSHVDNIKGPIKQYQ